MSDITYSVKCNVERGVMSVKLNYCGTEYSTVLLAADNSAKEIATLTLMAFLRRLEADGYLIGKKNG